MERGAEEEVAAGTEVDRAAGDPNMGGAADADKDPDAGVDADADGAAPNMLAVPPKACSIGFCPSETVLLWDPNTGDVTFVVANAGAVVFLEAIVAPKIDVVWLLGMLVVLLRVAIVVDGVPKMGVVVLANVPVVLFKFSDRGFVWPKILPGVPKVDVGFVLENTLLPLDAVSPEEVGFATEPKIEAEFVFAIPEEAPGTVVFEKIGVELTDVGAGCEPNKDCGAVVFELLVTVVLPVEEAPNIDCPGVVPNTDPADVVAAFRNIEAAFVLNCELLLTLLLVVVAVPYVGLFTLLFPLPNTIVFDVPVCTLVAAVVDGTLPKENPGLLLLKEKFGSPADWNIGVVVFTFIDKSKAELVADVVAIGLDSDGA